MPTNILEDNDQFQIIETVRKGGKSVTTQTVWKPGSYGANLELLHGHLSDSLAAAAKHRKVKDPTVADLVEQVRVLTQAVEALTRIHLNEVHDLGDA